MDVLDLDFSPRDVLASASIDNRILLWDMTTKQPVMSPFRVLHQHVSFVKGISFDPVGKYLASCGTDNKVILWDCNSWEAETNLTEPMRYTADKSMFRRMTWSPDGASLCLSSATKSSKNIGVVLRRGTWEATADLVGHDTQSTCCRFCPSVLTTVDAHKRPLCVVGLADQTGVVSIWSTAKTAPLIVLRECFDEAVTDITWDREGKGIMVACSVDGSIAIVDDINPGVPMKEDQLDKHFRALYGRGAKEAAKEQTPLAQNALSLKYSGKSDIDEVDNSNNGDMINNENDVTTDISLPPTAPVAPKVHAPQVVYVNKDGKKRIAPKQINGGSSFNSTQTMPMISASSSSSGSNSANTMASRMLGSIASSSSSPSAKRPRLDAVESAHSLVKITLNRNEVNVVMPMYPKNTNRTIEYLVSSNFKSSSSISSSGVLSVLRATHVIPPREISQPQLGPAIPFHSSCMTSVSMMKGTKLKLGNDEGKDDSVVWKTTIAGQATCISGQHNSGSGMDDSDVHGENESIGLCVIGCSDGSLHTLSIESGVRVAPPMVLGAAIASLELVDNHLLALTADGEVWKWEIHMHDNNYGGSSNDEILLCKLRTNVRPVILAVKTKVMVDSFRDESTNANNDQLLSAIVERCYMHPTNKQPVIHIRTNARGGVGGDLQMFSYSASSQTWIRLADMRYVLSSATRQITTNGKYKDTHIDALQDEANRNAGISSHAIAALSRPVTSHDTGNNLRQYLEGITLSHTEERLTLACTIGNCPDMYHWLSEWVKACCRSEKMKEKVKWLVNELIKSDAGGLPLTKQLLECGAPKDIIEECILPAIAVDGMSENLLDEIHQSMTFVMG